MPSIHEVPGLSHHTIKRNTEQRRKANTKSEEMPQSVKWSPYKHGDLSELTRTHVFKKKARQQSAYNSITMEANTGRSQGLRASDRSHFNKTRTFERSFRMLLAFLWIAWHSTFVAGRARRVLEVLSKHGKCWKPFKGPLCSQGMPWVVNMGVPPLFHATAP